MLRARAKGSSDHSRRYGNLEYTVSVRTLWVAWHPKNSASSFFCKISDISKVIYPLQKIFLSFLLDPIELNIKVGKSFKDYCC